MKEQSETAESASRSADLLQRTPGKDFPSSVDQQFNDPQPIRKSSAGWTRTSVNLLLDIVLLLTFSSILLCAAIVRFIFPPALNAAGWRLWGWRLDQWHDLLFAAIAMFAGLTLLHVMLHWNWVCGVVSSKLSKWAGRRVRIDEASQTLWGVLLLMLILAVIGVTLIAAALTVARAS